MAEEDRDEAEGTGEAPSSLQQLFMERARAGYSPRDAGRGAAKPESVDSILARFDKLGAGGSGAIGGQAITPSAAPSTAAPSGAPSAPPDLPNIMSRFDQIGLKAAGTRDPLRPAPEPAEGGDAAAPMGFFETVGSAAKRGLEESVANTLGAGQAILPGQSAADLARAMPPEHQDELGRLLKEGVFTGWSKPKWWGATIGHAVGDMAPSFAIAKASGLLLGPLGEAGGFALGMGMNSFLPAVRRGLDAGLSDKDAVAQGLEEAGISAATGAAMGLAAPITKSIQRPVTEAMIQMGLIQPTIGTAGAAAGAAVEGRKLSFEEAATAYVGNAFVGGGIWGLHKALPAAGRLVRPGAPETPPTEESKSEAFQLATEQGPKAAPGVTPEKTIGLTAEQMASGDVSQVPGGGKKEWDYSVTVPAKGKVVETPKEPAAPPKAEGEAQAPEAPKAALGEVAAEALAAAPESATSADWMKRLRGLKNVRAEDVEALKLPLFLADGNGKVAKADLLAHIEAAHAEATVEPPRFDHDYPLSDGSRVKAENFTSDGPFRDQRTLVVRTPGAPPVARGSVRVYHGGPPEGGEPPTTGGGRWVTPDHAYARDYRRTPERPGKVWYADIPEESPLLRKTFDDTGTSVKAPYAAFEAPEHIAKQMKPFGEAATRGLARVTERIDRDGKRVLHVEELSDPNRPIDQPPDRPWSAMMFRSILRHAADEGFERVSFASGDQLSRVYPVAEPGLRALYDKEIPRLIRRYATMLGTGFGDMRLHALDARAAELRARESGAERSVPSERMKYLEVNPAAGSGVRQGRPLASARIEESKGGVEVEKGLWGRNLSEKDAARSARLIQILAKRLGINEPIWISFRHPDPGGPREYGHMSWSPRGYQIDIFPEAHQSRDHMIATMAHELGHVVMYERFDGAAPDVKAAIQSAHAAWQAEQVEQNLPFSKFMRTRSTAVAQFYAKNLLDRPVLSLTPERIRYWLSFEEWFAEQVSRWATSAAKPMGVVEAFFSDVGKKILDINGQIRKFFGMEAVSPSDTMANWLDSLMRESAPFAADIYGKTQLQTVRQAQAAFRATGAPEVDAVPLQTAGLQSRGLIAHSLMPEEVTPEMKADAGHADRMNVFYRWMISLPQLAEMNQWLKPLQRYAEKIGLFHQEIRERMELPLQTLSLMRRLGAKQGAAVARLMDSWGQMRYRSESEVALGERRHPTKEEFDRLVAEHGVSEQGLNVFKKMVSDVNGEIDRLHWLLQERANRIVDPNARAEALVNADEAIRRIKSFPYYPIVRRGAFNVAVHDSDGNIVHFERFTSEKLQKARAKDLEGKIAEGERVISGKFEKDVEPFFGLPRHLLDIFEKEDFPLSQSQRAAMKLLKYETFEGSPYAEPMDANTLIRSYAKYFFHSTRYFARAKWNDQLRQDIADTRNMRYEPGRTDASKLDDIANFMSKHFDYVMNPKPDFATLRGIIFTLRLGFSPTTAGLYLTQTPLATWPWLAHHFGDVRASVAMMKEMVNAQNFYKGKTIAATTAPEFRAQRDALRTGTLDGGEAPTLAAVSEGRGLEMGFGGNPVERAWHHFQEYSGAFLNLADKGNRRLAFATAWRLAMENPGAKYLDRVVERYPQQFEDLQAQGYSAQEARAYLAGKHTVEYTHYIYQRWARPQFMWGKQSALFMFQFWKQNMLFTLWNYPSVAARSLLVMFGMAGLMGLPFAQDIRGAAKAIGYRLFGKDWDIDREIRDFVTSQFDGRVDPDILLHGLSRTSMGIPHVLDMMGHIPYPSLDRSSAIGLGDVLPVNPGELLGPTRDPNRTVARQAQDAAGAAFGFGFDLYQTLIASKLDWTDAKRWERIMPHAMLNASRAFRWYREGMERDASGNPVVKFDPHDTVQMMEILARAAGYNPTRLMAEWDRRNAMEEVKTFWQLRRTGLIEQAWQARKVGDDEAYARVLKGIQTFNETMPEEMRPIDAIKADTLKAAFRRKLEVQREREQGTAPKRELPLFRDIQRLFPSADVVARRGVQ